jgi:fructose-bisphosphate aldolase class II
MKKALEVIKEAQGAHRAVFHFNVSNLEMFNAIVSAALSKRAPIFLGVSEGERNYMGLKTLPILVSEIRQDTGLLVFSNADHTKNIENVIKAARAGFDAITVDASSLPLDEAIDFVRNARKEALAINENMLIEGEIGFIGHSSEIIEDLPYDPHLEKSRLTDPNDAMEFVEKTEVDIFSPAVGNFHGMHIDTNLPSPDFDRIRLIKKSVGDVPLVLHGGSGLSNNDLKLAAEAGVSLIHISSELRLAYKKALEAGLKQNTLAPYKYAKGAVEAVQSVVLNKLMIFKN